MGATKLSVLTSFILFLITASNAFPMDSNTIPRSDSSEVIASWVKEQPSYVSHRLVPSSEGSVLVLVQDVCFGDVCNLVSVYTRGQEPSAEWRLALQLPPVKEAVQVGGDAKAIDISLGTSQELVLRISVVGLSRYCAENQNDPTGQP